MLSPRDYERWFVEEAEELEKEHETIYLSMIRARIEDRLREELSQMSPWQQWLTYIRFAVARVMP